MAYFATKYLSCMIKIRQSWQWACRYETNRDLKQ